MLRVLYAHNRYLIPGGEDVSTLTEVEMLRKAGHVADLWEVSNEAIREIGPMAAGIRAVWSREAAAELDRRLAAGRYDLLHVQNYFPLLSPAVHRVATARGIATVQHLRNFRMMCVNASFFREGRDCRDCQGSFAPWRGVIRKCYKGSAAMSLAPAAMVAVHKAIGTFTSHVDAYIAISHYVRDSHCNSGLPEDRIHMRYDTLAAPAGQIAQGQRKRAIVAPLRLTPEKGIDRLIAAWQLRPRDAVLHVAGAGSDELRLKALAGQDPSIRFEGQLPHAALMELMATARCIVNPSVWAEPFGRTPMEAFSVGTPAIVSRIGGLTETVEHGRNGFHVEPGDVAGLDVAIDLMLGDDEAHRRMCFAALKTYTDKFAPSVILPETEAIYEKALRRRRSLLALPILQPA